MPDDSLVAQGAVRVGKVGNTSGLGLLGRPRTTTASLLAFPTLCRSLHGHCWADRTVGRKWSRFILHGKFHLPMLRPSAWCRVRRLHARCRVNPGGQNRLWYAGSPDRIGPLSSAQVSHPAGDDGRTQTIEDRPLVAVGLWACQAYGDPAICFCGQEVVSRTVCRAGFLPACQDPSVPICKR